MRNIQWGWKDRDTNGEFVTPRSSKISSEQIKCRSKCVYDYWDTEEWSVFVRGLRGLCINPTNNLYCQNGRVFVKFELYEF